MSQYFDELETRTADARAADQLSLLNVQLKKKRVRPGMRSC